LSTTNATKTTNETTSLQPTNKLFLAVKKSFKGKAFIALESLLNDTQQNKVPSLAGWLSLVSFSFYFFYWANNYWKKIFSQGSASI